MSEKQNEKLDDAVSSTGGSNKASMRDPLDSTVELISQEIPPGVDRRTFLMRSAVVGAAVLITGNPMSAQEQTARATAPPPPLDPKLNVVQKGKGPVMTLLDEFYKVGPGPSSEAGLALSVVLC